MQLPAYGADQVVEMVSHQPVGAPHSMACQAQLQVIQTSFCLAR